jgi:hypothetical protein
MPENRMRVLLSLLLLPIPGKKGKEAGAKPAERSATRQKKLVDFLKRAGKPSEKVNGGPFSADLSERARARLLYSDIVAIGLLRTLTP